MSRIAEGPTSRRPRRVRDLGVVPGTLPSGRYNAITDVTGVHIGHTTIVRGTDIRTGVTAVVPTAQVDRWTLPAALSVGNGYGKLVGSTQIAELGTIETPIVLTATLSVFRRGPGTRAASGALRTRGERTDAAVARETPFMA